MQLLLADDDPNVRSALRLLVKDRPGLQVAGEAADTGDLLRRLEANCPALILLDWELPGLHGKDLLSALRSICPEVKVIAMSSRPEAQKESELARVDGFICKSDPPDALLKLLAGLGSTKDEWSKTWIT